MLADKSHNKTKVQKNSPRVWRPVGNGIKIYLYPYADLHLWVFMFPEDDFYNFLWPSDLSTSGWV